VATVAEIAIVKAGLPNDVATEHDWDDPKIAAIIDATDSTNHALRSIWDNIANNYLLAVDISESGSSRSMGVYYDRAMAKVKYYDDAIEKLVVDARARRQKISFGKIDRGGVPVE